MMALNDASDDEFLLSFLDLHDMRESLGLGQKVLRVSINFNEENLWQQFLEYRCFKL